MTKSGPVCCAVSKVTKFLLVNYSVAQSDHLSDLILRWVLGAGAPHGGAVASLISTSTTRTVPIVSNEKEKLATYYH